MYPNSVFSFLKIFFSIKNKTNNKLQEIFIYKKIKLKSDSQPKTEPLPNLHLTVPSQHIKPQNNLILMHCLELIVLPLKRETEE